MKKLLSILTVFVLIAQVQPLHAKKVKKLTRTITWELKDDSTLIISGTGAMPDFKDCQAPWSKKANKIHNIVIKDGITSIGNSSFASVGKSRYKLTSITLPSSLNRIGHRAFLNCVYLDSLRFPEGLTNIGNKAFYGGGLKEISLPSTLKSIGAEAFRDNDIGYNIGIPNGVTYIGPSAFRGNRIMLITIPDSMTSIEESTFRDNYIKHVVIPYSVTSIGKSAFANNSIGSIIIYRGVSKIGDYAFFNNKITELKLPEGLLEIGYAAFAESLTASSTLYIPNSVQSIGHKAFSSKYTNDIINDNFEGKLLNAPSHFSCNNYRKFGISLNSSYASKGYFDKGYEYYAAKDYKTALRYFLWGTQVYELDSTHSHKGSCYLYAGRCYSYLKDPYKELEMMMTAKELGETDANPEAVIAKIKAIELDNITALLSKGEHDKAFTKCSEAYTLSKSYSDLKIVPEYFEKKNDYSNAVKYYKKAYEIKSDSSLAKHIADIYFKQKDYTNAIEWYSIKAQAGDKETQYKLAQAYEKSGNKNLAIFWYRKAAEQKHLKAEEALAHYGVYITHQPTTSTSSSSASKTAPSTSQASSNRNIREAKNSRANRPLPFSLAYCLDGTTQDISTKEIMRQNPIVGYLTFYDDKIKVDNEVYKYRETKDEVRIFEGPTVHAHGGTSTPFLFVNPDYNIINLFFTVKNSAGKNVGTLRSVVYLMEVDEFNTLWSQNDGISTNLFVTNSDISHTEDVSNYSSSGGSKSYYNSNYGWKDCHLCRGSGECPTCHGDGIMDAGFGNGYTKCPNCSTTASRKGVCSVCQGKGKVFGVKY